MTIDGDAAYQVLLAHDARFDGRLFVGVTSTGVYCRPICRVRMPARRNCRFFASPAQAEAASFRPCLKCRPEIAPGPGLPWTVMDASRTLARQAASALDDSVAEGECSERRRDRRQARVSDPTCAGSSSPITAGRRCNPCRHADCSSPSSSSQTRRCRSRRSH
jgi:methylphosphotriester-DNA--protein-cysteine methyltransferase